VSGKRWTCLVNCWSPDTLGTEVDYHWDVTLPASYGYVAHRSQSKEIIVSFRGSTILMDWIQDFSFLPVSWPKSIEGSKVHNGFLFGYTAAADGIKKTLKELTAKYPDYKIVVTGHSLGGAIAAVATADLLISFPEWKSKMELYTYGEPRVGNPAFAHWLSSQNIPIFRVVNRGDMVPQVPTRWMNFEHHTQEVWYSGRSKDAQFCGGESLENDQCQNSLLPIQLSIINHLQYPGLSPSL
ncbi:alpha/beta-hydrolase, partial [Linderina pennispora]